MPQSVFWAGASVLSTAILFWLLRPLLPYLPKNDEQHSPLFLRMKYSLTDVEKRFESYGAEGRTALGRAGILLLILPLTLWLIFTGASLNTVSEKWFCLAMCAVCSTSCLFFHAECALLFKALRSWPNCSEKQIRTACAFGLVKWITACVWTVGLFLRLLLSAWKL